MNQMHRMRDFLHYRTAAESLNSPKLSEETPWIRSVRLSKTGEVPLGLISAGNSRAYPFVSCVAGLVRLDCCSILRQPHVLEATYLRMEQLVGRSAC